MRDEAATEAAIRAKGLNAPRVTPDMIDAAIASEFYFTAGDGVRGESHMGTSPAGIARSLETLTFCVLVLRNGFVVTGESACASPENFDAAIGRRIARENARAKIWALEGYLLRAELAGHVVPQAQVDARQGHLARVLQEAGKQFLSYAEQHRAKGTEDGFRKAAVNDAWAVRCLDAEEVSAYVAAAGEGQ